VRCGGCGDINPAGNRFCQACGLPITIVCTACGHTCPPSAAFCGRCGAELGPTKLPGARALTRRASTPQGELKQVTVLFADLVSSTELVASLDAEAAMWRLKPALDIMRDAVERVGGTVVRMLGDGILALFGAPHALERHALLACQAGLAIRDGLQSQKERIAVRIGLHSGEVVIDAPSDDPLLEPGAYGLTLHLGSRLPAMVSPGGICISSTTYRLVRAFCDVVPLGSHRLRGIPASVELFQLLGLKPAVASQQFRSADLTPFRGRDHEMSVLQRALLAAERGAGQLIGVVGGPGTGKSRLCFEFAEWCRGRLVPVFEARAQPYGAATPWQPVIEFLRSAWFHIARDDEPASARRSIAEHLAELGPAFAADLPLVADFLGVQHGERPVAWLSPRVRIARLLDIFRHLIRRHGSSTSVIVFEDLHWLDDASEEFVAVLADTVAETRTTLVVNYRPAYVAPWMQAPQFQQIQLAELNPSDTAQIVARLIGPRRGLESIQRRVAERSGGNPFFAEELVRSLVEQSVLTGQRGDYRQGAAESAPALPATVQAVIGARIDRLPPPEREVLHIGSIIGKEFPAAVLQRVAERSLGELQDTLEHLCAVGLLRPNSAADPSGYSFCHPLIQEVAYSTQLRVVRSKQHAAVARAMERLHHNQLDQFAALLAYHFDEANEVQQAAHYAARAARWLGSTSPSQAIRLWHKVRALMTNQPRSRESDALRIMASSQIVWLGWREGLSSELARLLIQEALGWARESDDSMIPLLLFVEGRIAGASGGPADAYVAVVKQALSLMRPDRDAGRIATLSASLCQAYGWAGLIREALQANDAALAGVPSVTDFDNQFLGYSVEHWALSLRGRILVRLGRADEARACFDQVLDLQGLTDPVFRQMAYFPYFELAWCLDDPAIAEEHAGQAAAIAAYQGSPYLEVYSSACSGIAASLARDHRSAVHHFTEGLGRLRETRVAMEFEPEMLAYLAEALVRYGAYDLAVETGREAIAVARQRNIRLAECRACMSLATALVASRGPDALDESTALLDDADALIHLTGIRIYDRLFRESRRQLAMQATGSTLPTHE
jgi:adenylate cyclase